MCLEAPVSLSKLRDGLVDIFILFVEFMDQLHDQQCPGLQETNNNVLQQPQSI